MIIHPTANFIPFLSLMSTKAFNWKDSNALFYCLWKYSKSSKEIIEEFKANYSKYRFKQFMNSLERLQEGEIIYITHKKSRIRFNKNLTPTKAQIKWFEALGGNPDRLLEIPEEYKEQLTTFKKGGVIKLLIGIQVRMMKGSKCRQKMKTIAKSFNCSRSTLYYNKPATKVFRRVVEKREGGVKDDYWATVRYGALRTRMLMGIPKGYMNYILRFLKKHSKKSDMYTKLLYNKEANTVRERSPAMNSELIAQIQTSEELTQREKVENSSSGIPKMHVSGEASVGVQTPPVERVEPIHMQITHHKSWDNISSIKAKSEAERLAYQEFKKQLFANR